MFNPIISCKKNVETYTLPPIWRHFNYHLSIPLHVHPKKIGSSQLSPIPRSETALCHLDVQRSKSTGKTRVFSSSVGFEVSTASSCTTTFTFFSGFCSITSWGEQWVEVDESIRGETSLVNQKQKNPTKHGHTMEVGKTHFETPLLQCFWNWELRTCKGVKNTLW